MFSMRTSTKLQRFRLRAKPLVLANVTPSVLPNMRLRRAGGDRSKENGVLCAPAHNTLFPLEGSPPASFKRMLGSTLGVTLARTKGFARKRKRCNLVLVLIENIAGLLTLEGGNNQVFVVKELSEGPHSSNVLGCRRLEPHDRCRIV